MPNATVPMLDPASGSSVVSGPTWTDPNGTPGYPHYPLNVEAPILAALDRLTPGISPPSGSGPEWLTLTGRHTWPAEDRPRRASLRMLARAAQLLPEAEDWQEAAEQAVAYDTHLTEDPVLRSLEVAQTWRGLLLRRHSADAWRRWWTALADHPDPHQLTTDALPDVTVAAFTTDLPPHTDPHGHPAPAELTLARQDTIPGALAVLLIGSQRAETLRGKAKAAFLGETGVYLDPGFVAHRAESQQSLRALGRQLVDDMLAQAHRITVRHNQPGPALATGHPTPPGRAPGIAPVSPNPAFAGVSAAQPGHSPVDGSPLPPADPHRIPLGTYRGRLLPADPTPLPLRLNTLGDLALSHHLFSRTEDDGLGVTPLGARLLEVSP
ncbi:MULTISPECIES: hypothetical protein [unclassified Crossiella]|uniref:hypothetical protein n=1 Tax=unclassified Crossiella TaxID=2620835 RepID=UPI001FFE3B0B|nr:MULTISPECIES: hypothetical protein [unclassified Crossiella]MCK2239887.1 hypothetical protein [Crossiella sp. S99.2]MCK2252595.1 hypothetical protein [Crossiella sp. S99.1]